MTPGSRLLATLLVLSFASIPANAAVAQTRIAVHATQEEIDIWNNRRVNGPFIDDWKRIIARAQTFKALPDATWSGQTTSSCWLGEPAPGRDRGEQVRDAGFVYLLTGDTSYSTPVRTHLLAQAAVTGTDFTNSTRWCSNAEMNNIIDLGPWLRRLAYAYNYIKPTLSAADITTLDAWFRGAGNYLNTKMDNRVKLCFPNYQSGDWTVSCGTSSKSLTHHGGNMVQNQMGVFQNQEAVGMSSMTAIAVVLNDSTLKASAVRFVKGWLRVGVFADGTNSDQYRWIHNLSSPGDPPRGYLYTASAIGSFVSAADHLQRAGESIYEYTTSEGVGNTVGGPKSVGLVVKRLAQMQQHLVDVYGSTDGTLLECERIDDFHDRSVSGCTQFSSSHRIVHDMAPMAVSNMFYKDNTVAASYSRTPHLNPTSGGYDGFGGDWGNYPGARFMFGAMEDRVWPYSATAPNSSPTPSQSSQGPIGHWTFDEGFGTSAKDVSGTGNHGNLVNGATWTTGKFGSAVHFDGIDDFVKIATTGFSTSQGTLSLWVKSNSLALRPQYIFGHTSVPAFANRVQLYADDAAGNLDLGLGAIHKTALNTHQLTSNTWYHITLTWSSGAYAIHVDGAQKTAGSYSDFASLNGYAHIGGVGVDSKPESWSGAIDEVKVWNRSLSPIEVQNEFRSYDTPKPQAPTGLSLKAGN
jgi:hypothetical protein